LASRCASGFSCGVPSLSRDGFPSASEDRETVTVVYDPADAAGTAEIDSAVVWLPVVKMGALLTLLTVSGSVAKAC
jgi:hypothetical protein